MRDLCTHAQRFVEVILPGHSPSASSSGRNSERLVPGCIYAAVINYNARKTLAALCAIHCTLQNSSLKHSFGMRDGFNMHSKCIRTVVDVHSIFARYSASGGCTKSHSSSGKSVILKVRGSPRGSQCLAYLRFAASSSPAGIFLPCACTQLLGGTFSCATATQCPA